MERIGAAGLSIHATNVDGLESVRRPSGDALEPFLRELSDVLGASEMVWLATCNRIEVVYAREEGDVPGEHDLDALVPFLAEPGADVDALREGFVLRSGREAVHHVFRVASSLDSLVLGEDQIIAQVREAYGAAADIGLVGTLLDPLFHHALAIGKKVRSETELARHPVSVVNLAVHALAARPDSSRLKVGVIGAGEMGQLLARVLSKAGFTPSVVANRSVERARGLADDCGAVACSLDALRAGEHPVDAVVAATSAPGAVLDAEALDRLAACAPLGRGLFGVDLAVPRDLAADAGDGVEVVDLDALRGVAAEHQALRAEAAAAAEVLVERKVETYARRTGERWASAIVGNLREDAEEIVTRELQGLLSGRLAHLDDKDRRAVERWARATFGRVMHLPVTALKRIAVEKNGAQEQESDVD